MKIENSTNRLKERPVGIAGAQRGQKRKYSLISHLILIPKRKKEMEMEALKKWQDWEKMEARIDAYCEKLNEEYESLVKEKGVRSIEATAAFYTYIGALEACGEMIAIYWGMEG